ncbi:hypothetical protein INT48_004711 [Thamnidium elegans]|uniref:Cas12f1-like TNB domain-containing protein n=1 Tax=Thamnidium elegans TaxID=101142 RepID=A0A8H7SR04_9FUNG|nr:hypothetical protein INT48_004711 [Thamnidium elegans]
MPDIPIYKYTPLPALEVKITIPFDDYEAYIKKEPEVHGVKWVYKSYRCASGLMSKDIIYKSDSWPKYYQHHRAGTPRKRTRDNMENPPVQKELKKIDCKAKFQISFDPADPSDKTIIAISRRSLVILVDEFRTSVTCSRCHGTLEKKYTRQKEGEEHCKYLIYCLKVFPTCLDGKKIWHRDVNAAINIKDIMMDYINSQYDIKSRHPSLCRGTPPAVILPTATSS